MVATLERRDVRQLEFRGGNRAAFLASDPECLVEGPAGSGKTMMLAYKLHLICSEFPNVRILMARKVLEDLKPAALSTYVNKVKDDRVTPFGGNRFYPAEFRYPNGSVILVIGLDKPGKVLSSEFDVIYVNECTEISETDWETLSGRLRNGALPYQQLIGDCNPSGPRHWLNQRCNSGKTRRITTTHKDNPAYWDETAQDWTPLGRQYVTQTLAGMSGVMRDRYYLGKWSAAEGLVYPEFGNANIMTRDDLTGWRCVMGVDVGSRNPTAILTGYVAGDERIHIGREVYRRNMTSSDILDAITTEADRAKPDAIYIDPSAKGVIDDLARMGYRAYGANHDVLAGIRRVHAAFQTGLTVDPSCVNLIDEFGMYAYPTKDDSDKPVKEHDHAQDAARYLCMGVAEDQPPSFALAGMPQRSKWR